MTIRSSRLDIRRLLAVAAHASLAAYKSRAMRYRDITLDVGDRFRLPASHPILAEITIDPAHWYDFERLNADNPATRILGHDKPRNGLMAVFIACASEETRTRLEDGWG